MRINAVLNFLSIFLLSTMTYGAVDLTNDFEALQSVNLKIVQAGEPGLRQIARPLTQEEITSSAIQQLIVWMKNTMRTAPGVGLAAPQVGIPLQLAVIEDDEAYTKLSKPKDLKARDRQPVSFHVIINPKLTLLSPEKQADFHEGCLSINGFMGRVSRAQEVMVEALNEKGEPIKIVAKGWYARILQHEIDHLNGILYVDRMDPRSFTTIENYKKFFEN